MNKYKKIPDYIIDLHGKTKHEVGILLGSLFGINRYRHVRIITGKGLHGLNGPVVRTYVKKYLNERGIRFNQAKIEDGGEGALDVFID